MGFQIKNSNQFASWEAGSYLTPADMLVGKPGSNLPDQQSDSLTKETQISVIFALRRNSFENSQRPKGFLDSEKVLNLSYKKQVKYINSLSNKEIREWYGASSEDLDAARSYLARHNAIIEEESQEKRFITATLSLEDFRAAFLAEKPDTIFNNNGLLYYYNPNDFADSYLEASGDMAEGFANAVIGVEIGLTESTSDAASPSDQASNRSLSHKESDNQPLDETNWGYYPNEIGAQYNFPGLDETQGGKGITIGLVGSGGSQFSKVFSQNNAFNKYLKEQGINPRKLGKLDSPNAPENFNKDEWYSESAMDYSILRSIAPYADLVVSGNSETYIDYAELIYNKDVDMISSSVGLLPLPGVLNRKEAFHELFVDALLRGKPVVVAAGDTGTANNKTVVPDGSPIPAFSDGDSAILSVGGTAFSNKAQERTAPRPTVGRPTAMSPYYDKKTIDDITGLINKQTTWNQYSTQSILGIGDGTEVYPEVSDSFAIEDFVGSTDFIYYFENATGSSGVFSEKTIAMPAYQKRNLKSRWKDTGRRYPDVSVLAGSNTQENTKANYYTFTATPNPDKTAYEPVIEPGGGGTSAGAPLITGLLARIGASIKDRFGKNKKLGLVNPLLYEAYNSKKKGKVLIDVPAGSNNASVFEIAGSPDQWSGYTVVYKYDGIDYLIPVNGTGPGGQLDTNLSSTGKGFDAATGLGSINGQGLLDEMTKVFAQL